MKPSLPLLAALCAVSAASAETAPNVALSELGTAVKVAAATVSFDGGLSTPVSPFSPMLYEPGWTGHGATSVPGEDADGWHRFTMRTANASGAPRIDGRSRFAETGDGAIRAEWTATPSADATLAELFVAGSVPFSRFGGGTALLDGRALEIPVQIGPKAHLFRGAVTNFALLDRDGAERLRVAFDAPTRILLQDGRHWDGTALSLRFFFAEGPVEGGRRYEVRSTVRTPADGPLVLSEGSPVTLEAGPDWIPLEGAVWIEPGSALDFSRVVPHHAPAGRFGRVVAVGGHFEFEGLPGEPQRFYGVNLCGDANTPSTREAADRFAANLARMGYNAVRFHHHERALLGGAYREGMDDTRPDPAAMERFDVLVAACVEHGIYLTTDLFVSRSWFTTWRSLGIDRDGCITSTGDYKLLCAFWEPAFTNLCEWSRAFLGHVNPHTGRSLAEEPALCALALVNEGNLGNWNTAPLRDLPGVATAWRHWLAAKRNDGALCANDGALRANDGAADAANEGGGSAANEGAPVIVAGGDPVITANGGPVIAGAASPVIAAEGRPVIAGEAGPSFDWNSIPDEIPDAVYADDGSTPERRHAAAFAIFLAEREERLASRLRDFLRDELHCKAPISSLSCWYNPVQYQLVRERCFDYVDDHFYVDHPSFLGESWKLPSRCPNANPILGPGAGSRSCAFRRLLDKPFCITEWNYAGPGRYRGVGGIATGALGALQDWSGLWRFAWSHGKAGVETPEKKTMGYFDVSGDPLSLAAERAALCLFLRRDLEPLAAESPIVLDEAALLDPRNGAPKTTQTARLSESWTRRVGTRVVSHAEGESHAEGAEEKSHAENAESAEGEHLEPSNLRTFEPSNPESVRIDPETGTFLLDTPRTAGGFAESGTHVAGPLTFTLLPNDPCLRGAAVPDIAGAAGPVIAARSAAPSLPPQAAPSLPRVARPVIDGGGDPVAATVWVSSLDGEPIARSSHLLLTHLTDVQNSGIRYADEALTILLDWGKLPHLMRRGAARIELALDAKEGVAWRVFRLSPSGKRLGEVPCACEDETLRFTADTALDPASATYLYEIVREAAPPDGP